MAATSLHEEGLLRAVSELGHYLGRRCGAATTSACRRDAGCRIFKTKELHDCWIKLHCGLSSDFAEYIQHCRPRLLLQSMVACVRHDDVIGTRSHDYHADIP
jgi:hypothetical protein